ncbi:MAG: hypothetical protein MRZ66_01560 [Clostridiales bacterium]|nr:hypothetical protein [Clostridiales bacterium]
MEMEGLQQPFQIACFSCKFYKHEEESAICLMHTRVFRQSEGASAPLSSEVLVNNSPVPAKKLEKERKDLTGTINVLKKAVRKCNILIIDDLFSTGATITECTRKLKEDPLIDKVYVFAVSKTRT